LLLRQHLDDGVPLTRLAGIPLRTLLRWAAGYRADPSVASLQRQPRSDPRYVSPVLAAYVGETVTIRYDPRDAAEVRVYDGDEFLCRAIAPELAGDAFAR
jgi:Mu transposase, C-terminal